jgi:nucleotide-binding universal stress UspA family protein
VRTRSRTSLFDRVVCGGDRSEAGATAARAAALLASPEGSLGLVAVDDPSIAVHVGSAMPRLLQELSGEAHAALVRGRAEAEPLHALEAILVDGDPLHCLLAEIGRRDATLAAVGSHGFSLAAGFALGSVTTHLLHEAPCSVLIARGTIDADHWPTGIVVGLDGSPDSERALDAAREVSSRFGSTVRVITAMRDAHVDLEAVRRMAADLEEHDATPIDALTAGIDAGDLVVVGSRGMRGLNALGSLSERIAHEARCSVLVVRPED